MSAAKMKAEEAGAVFGDLRHDDTYYSHLSFCLAASIVCHCMFQGASALLGIAYITAHVVQ
jgi:hypothetical protein